MATNNKSKAVPNTNPCGLTAREVEIAVLAWQCVGEDGKVDYQKLATVAHINLAKSASVMWSRTKGKILLDDATKKISSDGDAPHPPSTPAKANNGSDDAGPSSVPSTKKKRSVSGAGKVAGRKRTMKEAGEGDHCDNDGAEDVERPKKAAKQVKDQGDVSFKGLPDATGVSGEVEAGEV